MRQRIAKFLVRVADHLFPSAHEMRVKPIDGYEPRKVAIAFKMGKKAIKDYRKSVTNEDISLREARRRLLLQTEDAIRKGILSTLYEKGMVEITTWKDDEGDEVMGGELKVYVKQETSEAAAEA